MEPHLFMMQLSKANWSAYMCFTIILSALPVKILMN